VLSANRAAFVRAVQKEPADARLWVVRGAEQIVVEVPRILETRAQRMRIAGAVLVSVAMVMGFALRVFWQSRAGAAAALLMLYSVLVSLILMLFAELPGRALTMLAGLSWLFIPASLAHLALTFPQERPWVRRRPWVVTLPYGVAASADLLVLVTGAIHEPAAREHLTVVTLLVTWGMVGVLSLEAARRAWRPHSPLERVRARLLLVGASGLPLTVGALHFGWGASGPGATLTPLVAGILMFTLPIGFAITRYDLFDLGVSARRGLDTALRLTTVGALTTLGGLAFHSLLQVRGPALWFLAGVVGCAATELLHERLGGQVGLWLSRSSTRRRAIVAHNWQRAVELAPEDASARLLAESLVSGLGPVPIAIFLRDTVGWRPSYAESTHAALRIVDARAAERALGSAARLHLARGDVAPTSDVEALAVVGVQLVVPIAKDGRTLGLILVGQPPGDRAYSSEETTFVETVAAHAAVAFSNARRMEEERASIRRVEAARMAADMLHEAVRPLRTIERCAQRAQQRAEETATVRELVTQIEDLAVSLLGLCRDTLRRARESGLFNDSRMSVERLFDDARAEVVPAEQQEQVCVRLEPGLPRVPHAQHLVRAVANLLDNALAACGPEGFVELSASLRADGLHLQVRDTGVGLAPNDLARIFDPDFTQRPDGQGHGVGLAIAREIVEDLGGRLEIKSNPGEGTAAEIVLPRTAGCTHIGP
jgi:signal transduction histidine kinase